MLLRKEYPGKIIENSDGEYIWYIKDDVIYEIDSDRKIKDVEKDCLYFGKVIINIETRNISVDGEVKVKNYCHCFVNARNKVSYCMDGVSANAVFVDENYKEEIFLEQDEFPITIFSILDGWYFMENFRFQFLICYGDMTYRKTSRNGSIRFNRNQCINENVIYTFHIPYKIIKRDCDMYFQFKN